MLGCPTKTPPSKKCNKALRILSRKKRKIQKALDKANPLSPESQPKSLGKKLPLIHYSIRDAIVDEKLFREEQAVGKIKTNSKYFYSYAKRYSKQKQSISMLFDKNGNIHTKYNEIDNILQDQFTSVFSNPLDTNLASAEFSIPPVHNPFSDSKISFSETDMLEAIDEIKTNASPGPDEIPTVLLSNCKHAVAKPIYLIWSMSLKSGKVPSCYKSSIVTPLYKKKIVVQFHPTIELFPSPLMSSRSLIE